MAKKKPEPKPVEPPEAPESPDPMLAMKLACRCAANQEHGVVRDTGDVVGGAVLRVPSGRWVRAACCPFCGKNLG
jgi:hypothetical protein